MRYSIATVSNVDLFTTDIICYDKQELQRIVEVIENKYSTKKSSWHQYHCRLALKRGTVDFNNDILVALLDNGWEPFQYESGTTHFRKVFQA